MVTVKEHYENVLSEVLLECLMVLKIDLTRIPVSSKAMPSPLSSLGVL